MTQEQADQLIAYMYSQNAETAAQGVVLGQIWQYIVAACILLLVIIFFAALRRN